MSDNFAPDAPSVVFGMVSGLTLPALALVAPRLDFPPTAWQASAIATTFVLAVQGATYVAGLKLYPRLKSHTYSWAGGYIAGSVMAALALLAYHKHESNMRRKAATSGYSAPVKSQQPVFKGP